MASNIIASGEPIEKIATEDAGGPSSVFLKGREADLFRQTEPDRMDSVQPLRLPDESPCSCPIPPQSSGLQTGGTRSETDPFCLR